MRIVHGGAQVGVALARAPVDKVLFTGSPAVGRAVARACVSQEKEVTVELGGKDAMLVLADAHVSARRERSAVGGAAPAAGQARGSVERIYVERGALRALPHAPGERRARAARRGPGAPGRADGPAGLAAAPGARARAGRRRGGAGRAPALRRPAGAAAGGLRAERGVLRAGGAERGDARDARDARAAGRAGAGGDERRLAPIARSSSPTTATTASGPRCGPPIATAGCASRASCTPAWCGSTTTSPRRRSPRGPWGAAAGGGLGRTLGETGLRGCAQEKLITWDPSGARGLWWPPYDELLRAGGAHGGAPALGARLRPRARLAPRRRLAGARRRARAAPALRPHGGAVAGQGGPAPAASPLRRLARTISRRRPPRTPRRERLTYWHARPGLCRQGVRVPVAQGDLRPVVRARDARDAVLHRLPEAHGPALRRGRRRRDRPGEGRGPAGLRRRRDADRARRACPRCGSWRGRARSAGSGARTPGRPTSRASSWRSPRPSDTDVNIARLRRRRAPRDARQRRRRAAAVQLHPAGDRAHRPAGDRDLDGRRLAGAGEAHQAPDRRRSSASPTRDSRCCSTRSAAGRRRRCRPTRTARSSSRGSSAASPTRSSCCGAEKSPRCAS